VVISEDPAGAMIFMKANSRILRQCRHVRIYISIAV
jgi:hypothetical protein